MSKKTTMIIAVALFIVGAVGGNYFIKMIKQPPEPSEQSRSLIGKPAPAFTLKALDGVPEESHQWLGKVQVLNFWATWCAPCQREIPVLIEIQNEYASRGVQIIGIAIDKKEQVERYAAEKGINYPVLVGEDDAIEVAIRHGNDVNLLPYTVFIDRDGKIAAMKYGEIDRKRLVEEIEKLL